MAKNKNITAIEKIIKELSYRDFIAAAKRNGTYRRPYNPNRKIQGYSLSADTMEALQVKWDYRDDKITEEEYKAFCMRYNLISLRENG